MGNPFEDDEGLYFVLINRARGFSIWPADVPCPQDWEVAFGPGTRPQCSRYVARHRPEERGHLGSGAGREAVHRC